MAPFIPTGNAPGQVAPGNTAPTFQVNPPASALNSGIVSSTGVQNEFNDASNAFDTFSNQGDPYAALLSQTVGGLESAAANTASTAISSATAKAANAENLNNREEASTIYGIRAQDAANGSTQFDPTGTNMAVTAAQNSFNAKYSALDLGERTAIANAKNAQQNGDTKALQQELTYAQSFRTAKQAAANEAFKEFAFNNLSADQEAALGQAKAIAGAPTVTTAPSAIYTLLHPLKSKITTSQKNLGNVGSPVVIKGSSYNTGQVVYNNQGQAGIVNADGTITPQ